MNSSRKRIGLLFGGRSAEHAVSKLSAANILHALDQDRYEVVPIGISRDGRWFLCEGNSQVARDTASLEIPDGATQIALIPGGAGHLVRLDGASGHSGPAVRLDVVFPVLHGPNGEDGTVQGLLELAGVPYVGSSVTGSAACMDKDVCKRLLREAGIPVVPFLAMRSNHRVGYEAAAGLLESPDLFVKPANMGSSIGVSRARSAEEFERARDLGFSHDTKLVVERSIAGAREIECSVLETASGDVRTSSPGEILPSTQHGFYTYDAKYLDPDGASIRIPADLAPDQARRVRDLAVQAFHALGCEALARVDFFVDPRRADGLFVNEVNTMPGFTAISLYPKMWEADGLSQPELVELLVAHALARHARRAVPPATPS